MYFAGEGLAVEKEEEPLLLAIFSLDLCGAPGSGSIQNNVNLGTLTETKEALIYIIIIIKYGHYDTTH